MIKEGNIKEANRYLGRPYKISGGIVHGYKNGEIIGFKTANLLPSANYVLPSSGVYFTITEINGVKYLSVTNVGLHPTIQKLSNRIIETHLIDYDENIYGEHISIYFYEKERDEVKFENLDELKERITQDVQNCEHFFKYKNWLVPLLEVSF